MTLGEVEPVAADYRVALREYGFETAAVAIRSAEGWHERYDWDDVKQRSAVDALQPSTLRVNGDIPTAACATLGTVCARLAGCATRRANASHRQPKSG